MRAYRKLVVHQRVMVNLRDGQAFTGVLLDEKGPLLVLGDAQLLAEGQWAPVGGQVLIERDRVLFVQIP